LTAGLRQDALGSLSAPPDPLLVAGGNGGNKGREGKGNVRNEERQRREVGYFEKSAPVIALQV